ncbi:uncharacterized protein LOC144437415, partial [Glandiceps talaboti]
MRNLSQQRAGWDDCDCPSDTHAKLEDDYVPSPRRTEDKVAAPQKVSTAPQPTNRKSRFAALAANINNWEDDTSHPVKKPEEKKPTRRWQPPKPAEQPMEEKQPVAAPRNSAAKASPAKPSRSNHASYRSTPVYSPSREREGNNPAYLQTQVQSPVKNNKWEPVKAPASPNAKTPHYTSPGPVTRSVVQKQEKSNASQPVPTTRNQQPVNVRASSSVDVQPVPTRRTTKQPVQPASQQKPAMTTTVPKPTSQPHQSSRVKTFADQISQKSQNLKQSPTSVSAKAKSIQAQLFKQQNGGWKGNEINLKAQTERNAELELLRNRWKVNTELPTPSNTNEEESEEEEEDVPPPPKKQKTPPRQEPVRKEMQTKQSRANQQAAPVSNAREDPALKRKAPQPPTMSSTGKKSSGNTTTHNTGTGHHVPSHTHSGSNKYKKYNPGRARLVTVPQPVAPPRNNPRESRPSRAQAVAEYMKRQAAPVEKEIEYMDGESEEEEEETTPITKEPELPKETVEPKEETVKRKFPSVEEDGEEEDDDDKDEEMDMMGELDDLLDEAIAKEDEEEEPPKKETVVKPTVKFAEEPKAPPRGRKPSGSNGVPKSTSADNIKSCMEEERDVPLLYSVECYRSQRKVKTRPPPQKIIKREPIRKATVERQESRVMRHMSNREKIQTLTEEISQQQAIIHQSTQALNLISSRGDSMKGTTEELEAERLLVIATQRRLACLGEVQRLKQEHQSGRGRNPSGETPSKGSVTIGNIRLPLKTEYIFSMGSKQDRQIHHFLVLIRNGAHVISTHLLSTLDGINGDCLPFTNMITMNDIGSDFMVDVEVYSMQTRRQEVKEKKGNLLRNITPRKSKRNASPLPTMCSPGGPGAVRTSNFLLVGTSKINLHTSRNEKFSLTKVPFLCPLEGSIHMKVKCYINAEVEE